MKQKRTMRATLIALLMLLATPALALAAPKTVIFFGSWSAGLDNAAQAVIAGAARQALARPGVPITVVGAADTDGSTEANRLLALLRAQVVKDQLVADGVSADRIAIHGIGAVASALSLQESRRASISIGD
jgi:outer membrane protein OmpA-like peptidoglycan-associated protein